MRTFAIAVVALLSPGIAWCGCAPEKMVRIVYRDATPGINPDSFSAQPTTIYRLGSAYSRIEEAVDSENGIHGLAISAEPDSWMINLATKTGQHWIDRSPPYVVRTPIFFGPTGPAALKSFEFGCELAYMKERGVRPQTAVIAGRSLDMYEVSEGPHRILLAVISGTERPLATSHFKDGKPVLLLNYLQYDRGLEPDLGLFKPPAGVKVTERTR